MNGESSPMSKTWFDPRVPAADVCVLRPLLDRHAAATPDKVFARFADGTEWTYRQTQAIARRTAIALSALGVAQGDKVLSWLPNGPDAIRVWFGLNYQHLPGALISEFSRNLILNLIILIAINFFPGISWQGHLGGAIGGLLAALFLHVQRFNPWRLVRMAALLGVPLIPLGFFAAVLWQAGRLCPYDSNRSSVHRRSWENIAEAFLAAFRKPFEVIRTMAK